MGFNMEEVLARVVQEEPDNPELMEIANLDTQDKQVLEAADLLAAGCTIDRLSEALYDTLHTNNLPNFLPRIILDRDGGLDRIDSLWTWKRYLFCTMQLAMALGNMVLLVTLNWSIFQNTFCSPLVQEIMKGVFHGSFAIPERNVLDEENLFHDIRNNGIRRHFMAVASVTATAEVFGILVLTTHGVHLLAQFANKGCLVNRQSEYQRFMALDRFFRKVLPMIGTFSALKLAALVHPAFIYSQFIDFMGEAALCSQALSKSTVGTLLAIFWFFLTRGFCAAVALMAFGVKLVVIGSKLCHPQYSGILSWLEALALLNSCIGTVLIEQQLQDRLFLFVFGGNDAEYQDNERSLRNVYHARMTKQIWAEYAQSRGKTIQAIALLATLDHYDLQTLLIEEINEEEALPPGSLHHEFRQSWV